MKTSAGLLLADLNQGESAGFRYPNRRYLRWQGRALMSYKDLLVVLDASAPARGRIDLATALAERFAAHLVGLYPMQIPERPRELGYFDPAMLDPFFAEARERARNAADKVREQFESVAKLRGVSAEWRVVPEGAEADPALHARYADLTILGQLDPDRGETEMIRPRPEQVTLTSGRPIFSKRPA